MSSYVSQRVAPSTISITPDAIGGATGGTTGGTMVTPPGDDTHGQGAADVVNEILPASLGLGTKKNPARDIAARWWPSAGGSAA